jgi:hypothetical protein
MALRRYLTPVLLILSLTWTLSTLLRLQFSDSNLTENDGPYHIAMAQTIREHGITRKFEWTQFSVWKENYSDKDFLFHVMLIPFTLGDVDSAIIGGKIFLVLLTGSIFASFFFILRAHGVPLAWLWTLVLLAASANWLIRMNMLRGHVLSVLMALWSIHFLLLGRWKPMIFLGFLFAWGYSAPQVIVVIAAALTVMRRLFEGTWLFRPILGAVGGLIGGFLIHPYFPNNVLLWWIQNPLAISHALGLGGPEKVMFTPAELYPTVGTAVLFQSTLAFGLFAATNLIAAGSQLRSSWTTLALLGLSWSFFVGFALSMRFVEYFVPAAVLGAALAFRDVAPALEERLASMRARVVAGAAAALVLAGSQLWAERSYRASFPPYDPWEVGVCQWLKENVPKGERVIHLTWDHFPSLFLRDRDHRYVVGMDPAFGYYSNRKEMLYLERINAGEVPQPQFMADLMGGRYVVVWKRLKLQGMAMVHSGAKVVFEDKYAIVFDLLARRPG